MRIWWQSSSPIHRLHAYRNALTVHLDAFRRPETSIHISGVDEGSMDLHYNAVVAMNSFGPGGVLDKIMQADAQGYDAVAIACFLDPAMQEAREVVSIPVLGMGETCMHMACLFGQRFSGVAFHAKQAQFYDRKAFEYGLAARHIPFGDLGMDFNQVQDGFARPQEMTSAFVREVRRLAQQGAEVVLAACATVNAVIHREQIREIDGVLILDSNAMLLKITESMADLGQAIGFSASRRLLYRQPDRAAFAEWKRIYGMRAGQVHTADASNSL